MAKRIVKTQGFGRVSEWERTLRTGSKDGVLYLIYELYSTSKQRRSLRFWPCDDPQSFVDRGIRYSANVTESVVREQVGQFQGVVEIPYDSNNPRHKVNNWVNMWTPRDNELEIRGTEPREQFSLIVELNVPASGVKFSYQGPFVADQNHAFGALTRQFNAHFQGCNIESRDCQAVVEIKAPKVAAKLLSTEDPLGIMSS